MDCREDTDDSDSSNLSSDEEEADPSSDSRVEPSNEGEVVTDPGTGPEQKIQDSIPGQVSVEGGLITEGIAKGPPRRSPTKLAPLEKEPGKKA